jgi:hypothetical protein
MCLLYCGVPLRETELMIVYYSVSITDRIYFTESFSEKIDAVDKRLICR